MHTIEVDDATYAALALAARLTRRSVAEIVRDLVAADGAEPVEVPQRSTTDFTTQTPPPTERNDAMTSINHYVRPHGSVLVRVFAKYLGQRIDGEYNPASEELTVRSGRLAGATYSSPTDAAVAVVSDINPGRAFPNTNGRMFWRIAANGRQIREAYGRR